MLVQSREYKVIVDALAFADVAAGLSIVLEDLTELGNVLSLDISGDFDAKTPKERTICFLDTPDFTLRDNDLLLRRRVKRKTERTEYTLKCRLEDRYIAAASDLRVGAGLKPDFKFEEDIGVPFVSRFSHSSSVTLKDGNQPAGKDYPATLGEAAKFFPILRTLQHDQRICSPQTILAPVNCWTAYERVFTGPTVTLADESTNEPGTEAELALILWLKGWKGRPLTAELSFRYAADEEAFSPTASLAARKFFEGLQRQDWSKPDARTKTQFMYQR